MDRFDIEASLRRIDKKFTQDLTEEQKKKAIKQFKKLYAEQMGKLAGELSKRVKVQQNLYHLNQKQKDEAKQIDQELRKRMEKHDHNREKVQENKQKEYKMCEENWKRKFDDIMRKNRNKQRQAYHKAEKMRRDVEQYFNKKHQTLNLRQTNLKSVKNNTTSKPYTSLGRSQKVKPQNINQHYTQYPTRRATFNVRLPDLTKSKLHQTEMNDKSLNKSNGESTLNDEIRFHQERCLQGAQQQESDKIQKYLHKLEKIEKTRKKAQEKMEKEVQKAKKVRQMRQNPEVLQANRRRSIQQLNQRRSPRTKKGGSKHALITSRSKNKTNLDASIYEHLESKKRLQEMEFDEREYAYEQSKQKMKQTKINRLVKDAINMLKHQTLNEIHD